MCRCFQCPVLTPFSVRAFISEKDKLEREEEETLARLLRLRKQKRALEERVKKAVSRELRDISDLEREEGATMSSSDPLIPGSSLLDPLSGFDWLADVSADLGVVGEGPSFLAAQGSGGGSPPVSQGSGGS